MNRAANHCAPDFVEHPKLDELRASAETGAVLYVTLRVSGSGLFVCAETRPGESTLIATRDKNLRRFVDSGNASCLLLALRIEKATVNLTHWRPDEIEFERMPRPNRASTYDCTLRANVEVALTEADASFSTSSANIAGINY